MRMHGPTSRGPRISTDGSLRSTGASSSRVVCGVKVVPLRGSAEGNVTTSPSTVITSEILTLNCGPSLISTKSGAIHAQRGSSPSSTMVLASNSPLQLSSGMFVGWLKPTSIVTFWSLNTALLAVTKGWGVGVIVKVGDVVCGEADVGFAVDTKLLEGAVVNWGEEEEEVVGAVLVVGATVDPVGIEEGASAEFVDGTVVGESAAVGALVIPPTGAIEGGKVLTIGPSVTGHLVVVGALEKGDVLGAEDCGDAVEVGANEKEEEEEEGEAVVTMGAAEEGFTEAAVGTPVGATGASV
mmetsp:Transcript_31484/g.53239  ORF Transcript_31484/g.53239 Transcript_31484/m.53239 type:complete len:297 (+) Transcript_31484:1542-2432(+)